MNSDDEIPSHVPDEIKGSGFFLPDEYEVMGRLWAIFLQSVSTYPMQTSIRLVNTAIKFSSSFKALHEANPGRATSMALFTLSIMSDQHLVEVSQNFKRVAERKDLELVPTDFEIECEVVKPTGVISSKILRAILNAFYWANRADLPIGVKR